MTENPQFAPEPPTRCDRAGEDPGASAPVLYLACELYQAWVAASQEADEALERWNAAPYGAKRAAYISYRAAADREDVAAEMFIRADPDDDS